MDTVGPTPLAGMSRRERSGLRQLLVAATAGAEPDLLADLVAGAPVRRLPAAATMHRVAAPVRAALVGVDTVPQDVLDDLETMTMSASLEHLRMVGALHEIGTALDAADVPWLAMKGPVLAGYYYRDQPGRPYSDLDLLVSRRSFGSAVRVLEAAGFGHAIKNWALAEQVLAGQVSMARGPVRVDLHWHLHFARDDRRPYLFEPERMLERARRVEASGLSIPTFDPVDTVVTVAFHAARSDGHALVWVKDLERIVSVEAIDADALVARAHAARCAPSVGLMMERSRELLGAPVSAAVISDLLPAPLAAADRLARRWADPVQFHQRPTLSRFVTRSVGPSSTRSLVALPGRGMRRLGRRWFAPPENETDDPGEKASYLRAVERSTER